MQYLDRRDAGRRLAAELMPFAREQPVVVALPRGGVPVAVEVARALRAPIEILAVRKIGAPGNPELAVGAVAEDGTGVLDPRSAGMLGMTQWQLEDTLEAESRELRRRLARYRHDRSPLSLHARTAIIVDDGMATGMTELAAVRAVRNQDAARVVVAVPVGSAEAVAMLEEEADAVRCLSVPRRLYGVGMWYEDFSPVSDDEVMTLLAAAREETAADGAAAERSARAADGPAPDHALTELGGASARAVELGSTPPRKASPQGALEEHELALELDGQRLPGSLIAPAQARGVVVFAHGSGSSRLSPRNRTVAKALAGAGLASLLFDLLGAAEAQRRDLAFDVPLLARRLTQATAQLAAWPGARGLPMGYFGASTGAAAALSAAAQLGGAIAAVVSRGGRPDLAAEDLERLVAPTLLIVGEHDRQVLELNRGAAERMRGPHELALVAGAGHLFEEPGALERVCELATGWFGRYLGRGPEAA
jgi:putative phosphoribosyl transferase